MCLRVRKKLFFALNSAKKKKLLVINFRGVSLHLYTYSKVKYMPNPLKAVLAKYQICLFLYGGKP